MRGILLALLWAGVVVAQVPAPKLFVWVEITPAGFGWQDLQLNDEAAFRAPLAETWARWWRENPVPTVGEAIACEVSCRADLTRWRAGETVDALKGAWLLEIRVTLTRTVPGEGLVPEPRFAWQGGMILRSLDDQRTRRWIDLSPEEHPIPPVVGKESNSRLASLLYRGPLGKFLALKGDFPPVGTRQRFEVIVKGAQHAGQLWEAVAWYRSTLAELRPEVELASFDTNEARILIFFHGEEEKLQALVKGKGGLESKLGPAFQSQYHPGGAVVAPPVVPAGPTEAP